MNQKKTSLDLTNLSIKQTKEFNACLNEHRKDFDQMLCNLSKKKNLHPEIFNTSIFSREPEFSPLYERCCKLAFIKKQVDTGYFDKIIVNDLELHKVLKRSYIYKVEGLNIHCTEKKIRYIFNLFLPFRNFLRSLSFAVFMILARQKSNVENIHGKDVILFSTNILKGSFEKNDGTSYIDRNFPDINRFVPKEQRDRLVFLPQFPGGPRPYNKKFEKLRKHKQSFLIKADYFKLEDYLYAFSYPIRIDIKMINNVEFLGFDITGLILREYWHTIFDFKIIESLLNNKISKRLKEKGIKITVMIDWYENQLSSKGLINGFRKNYPEAKIIGYCGIIDSALYRINLHPSEYENDQMLLPHQITVLGDDTKGDFMEFTKNIDITSAPSLRYKYLHEIDRSRLKDSEFTILVALPIFKDQARNILAILSKSIRSLEMINKIRIKIKTHPTQSSKIYRPLFDIESENCKFVDDNFFECISTADLLITSASTTCMEALAIGVPVAIIGAKSQILQNPIPKTIPDDYWRICYSSSELIGFSKSVINLNENELILESERIRDSYFLLPTNENIEELIHLNHQI